MFLFLSRIIFFIDLAALSVRQICSQHNPCLIVGHPSILLVAAAAATSPWRHTSTHTHKHIHIYIYSYFLYCVCVHVLIDTQASINNYETKWAMITSNGSGETLESFCGPLTCHKDEQRQATTAKSSFVSGLAQKSNSIPKPIATERLRKYPKRMSERACK